MLHRLTLGSAVGPGRMNMPEDVGVVQSLLNDHMFATRAGLLLVDGYYGLKTLSAMLAFQRHVVAMRMPDGVVDVYRPTIDKLRKSSVKPVLSPKPGSKTATGVSNQLTDADYKAAAATLGCEVAAIKAVATVETGTRGAFDAQGRPTILYERHFFSRLTGRVYDKTHPDISNRKPGSYGKFSEQYEKLDRAFLLDQDAALRSASWRAFQIMGDNYQAAGFASAAAYVAAMRKSIQDQLTAFVSFIKANPTMARAIQKKEWAVFAAAYNGPGYKDNDYDTKMAAAYAQNSK